MSQKSIDSDLDDPSGRNQAKPEKIANGVEKPCDEAHADLDKSPTDRADRDKDDEAVDIDSETGA